MPSQPSQSDPSASGASSALPPPASTTTEAGGTSSASKRHDHFLVIPLPFQGDQYNQIFSWYGSKNPEKPTLWGPGETSFASIPSVQKREALDDFTRDLKVAVDLSAAKGIKMTTEDFIKATQTNFSESLNQYDTTAPSSENPLDIIKHNISMPLQKMRELRATATGSIQTDLDTLIDQEQARNARAIDFYSALATKVTQEHPEVANSVLQSLANGTSDVREFDMTKFADVLEKETWSKLKRQIPDGQISRGPIQQITKEQANLTVFMLLSSGVPFGEALDVVGAMTRR